MTATMDRRSFLRTAAVGAGATVATFGVACTLSSAPTPATGDRTPPTATATEDFRWREATIADMQAAMRSGETTALQLVRDHVARIEALDWAGPMLNSVIEVNPDAEAIAASLDAERARGQVRGPLHGIPILLKDVFATADRMQTTAGSLALVGATPPQDAHVAARLRSAGAVLLGKNNLSEWNAFRGWPLHGGWSGRAGIGLNPYWLNTSTGDSSSGSAAAVSSSFAAGAVGLETYGSIVMPSALCGVVGLKPTVGAIGRSGTIGISFTRDAVGPIARTVPDVAALFDALAGRDPGDPATAVAEGRLGATLGVLGAPDALRGARIGVWRRGDLWKRDPDANAVIEALFPVLRERGAEVIDPVAIPEWLEATGDHIGVMFPEFRFRIDRYLSWLVDSPVRSLTDVVAFNEAHHDEELRIHSQNTLEGALHDKPLDHPAYRRALRSSAKLGRDGIDGALRRHRLDAILAPTFRRAWQIDLANGDDPTNGNGAAGPSNAAGYPHVTLPAGSVDGLPVGVSLLASAWEEPKLLRFAHALEQAIQAREAPGFREGFNVREFVPRSA